MNDDLLKKSILFKGMTDTERNECLQRLNAHRKSYKKGDAILHAGDLTDQKGASHRGCGGAFDHTAQSCELQNSNYRSTL